MTFYKQSKKKCPLKFQAFSIVILVLLASPVLKSHEGHYGEHPEKGVPIEPESPFCDLNKDGVIDDAEISAGAKCYNPFGRFVPHFFSRTPIASVGLKQGELTLTVDDGPNSFVTPQVLDVLKQYKIRATFFLTGNLVNQSRRSLLRRMIDEGHTIGNHTYSHNVPRITPGSIANEVLLAHKVIVDALGDGISSNGQSYKDRFLQRLLFRAPGLGWSSAKANALNSNERTRKYIGPIHANLGADQPRADWHCWSHGVSFEKCASYYFQQIAQVGRGIVLTHDVYGSPAKRNNTAKMLTQLLAKLEANGGIINKDGTGVWNFKHLPELPALNSYDALKLQAELE